MAGNTNSLNATLSYWLNNPNRPQQVSWDDVQVFLARLNAYPCTNIPVGWAYVLPTEAQWEYARRAGTISAFLGDDINASQANYDSIIGETTNVGEYLPNPWGFYDMHGNVSEWTADRWRWSSYMNALTDSTNPSLDVVRRGGSSASPSFSLRSAWRMNDPQNLREFTTGFRVAFKR